MLRVNSWLVSEEVLTTYFACDYEACHGYCCYGAEKGVRMEGCDLTIVEAKEIRAKRKQLAAYAPKAFRKLARRKPVYKTTLSHVTLHRSGSCIYCDKGCALKRAHADGVLSFTYPRFCQLAPLDFDNNGVVVVNQFYKDSFCKWGFKKGEREGIFLIDFLKDGIIRYFGLEFWELLKEAQRHALADTSTQPTENQ